jgi:hypothetical protein
MFHAFTTLHHDQKTRARPEDLALSSAPISFTQAEDGQAAGGGIRFQSGQQLERRF